MKHNLTSLQKIHLSKIHKTVGELRYDIGAEIECFIEELEQYSRFYSDIDKKSKREIINEVLG